MRQAQQRISIATSGRGLLEFTGEARAFLRASGMSMGQMTIFCRHSSASLLIQENADPSVAADLLSFFDRVAPEGRGLYRHENEGPDDMPAHIRTALTPSSLTIPFASGDLVLGTWQGIFLFEHRRDPRRREVVLHVIGE
ncbi:secondary thiamine-phosphate synthase enzyme YjbQ [Rhodoblastus acidophilus]|uniref:Secondary thiamine-phosphate synthase enzyme YjbQ n=1 Tax=Candidatus Rhodoblastus alkanivorans TaxID=2954117 RepID=A0ABS9ZAC9_9HYPH|nr:secondary thiamine-phosphate synthase enzyme YjbQ [Candidatus Rhodoblastus alkanivorans]MCI4678924.1 secondary thiamine-phosphate synthase enzyme YjbQ [Candidatus Rhodoblastus alkanivorans]MCI4684152.1 secondary thiamine-phosphate synthase enzyme YjbQ [Candidatus Rhodoblastus alkanivorans]MDI4641473.1 secondary thiamine-phosphate synthase enzyme YjbQ [Rhodoblastus acidophilus]